MTEGEKMVWAAAFALGLRDASCADAAQDAFNAVDALHEARADADIDNNETLLPQLDEMLGRPVERVTLEPRPCEDCDQLPTLDFLGAETISHWGLRHKCDSGDINVLASERDMAVARWNIDYAEPQKKGGAA